MAKTQPVQPAVIPQEGNLTTKGAPAPLLNDDGLISMSNVQILNTVRRYAPNDYQHRVPIATQGNISEVLRGMNSYQPNWDVFWQIFIGRIGRLSVHNRMNFQNPLAKLKQPSLAYGMTIQEVQTNLIKARVYNPNDANVFGREGREPDIAIAYHTQNRTDQYQLNIPMQEVLQGAFVEGQSIASFFNALAAAPVASNENDEYILMRHLLEEYDENNGFYNVHVEDLTDTDLSYDEQVHAGVKLIIAMRTIYNKMKYFRTEFSPYGRTWSFNTRSNKVIAILGSDQEAVIKAAVNAYAFHKEDQKIFADEIIILDEMPIAGAQALLIDADWFQCANTLGPLMLQSPLNPINLSYTYALTVFQILGYSDFLNAVMFSTRPDTDMTQVQSLPTAITLKDAQGNTSSTIDPDTVTKLTATVTGTANTSFNKAVRYEIKSFDGAGNGKTLPAECFVDSEGNFHARGLEEMDTVCITATSLAKPSLQAIYTFTISGSTAVTAIAGDAFVLNRVSGAAVSTEITFTPSGATNKMYRAYSTDPNVVITYCDSTKLTARALPDAPDSASIILVAEGGSKTAVDVTGTIAVTCQDTDPTPA